MLQLDGKPAEAAAALNGAAPKLRQALKHRLAIKHIPELHFHADTTPANADRLNRLIREAREEDRHHAHDRSVLRSWLALFDIAHRLSVYDA